MKTRAACFLTHRLEMLESRIAPATFTVTSNAIGGAGSLGEALTLAANSMGTDTIAFNLPMGQTTIVLPGSGITVNHPVIFDGRTQPGYVDSPLVTIQGASLAANGIVFDNGARGSQVLGLKVQGCSTGITIAAEFMTVAGCDIVENAYGIYVQNIGAVIGGPGATGKNVISGNSSYGIYGQFADTLTIVNSHIGVDRAGTTAMGNGGGGIYLDTFGNVTMGGTGRNVISANGGLGGIWAINSHGNFRLQSSTIGLSANLIADIAFSNASVGAHLQGGAIFSIGPDGMAGTQNYITNNSGTELWVNTNNFFLPGSPGTANILGNYIGTTFSGMALVQATAATTGIKAEGPNITIGGVGGKNVIFSQGDGISAEPGTRLGLNDFFQGNGLVIDVLPDGATPNDPGDLDGVQNKPVLGGVAIVSQSNQYYLNATLDSRPNESFTLRMYGFDGTRYIGLGDHGIQTDDNGRATFNDFTYSFAGFTQVAASVVSSDGKSSEMSAPALVAPGIGFVGNNSVSQIEGNTGFQILTFNVITTATPTGNITLNLAPDPAGTATIGADYAFSPSTIEFSPTRTSQVVSVIVSADTAVEPEEFVRLVLGNLTGNAVIVVPSVTFTIGNDDTSLKISADSKTATWIDADGDLVTLKTTKPVLNPGMFAMNATGTLGGELLQSIDFGFASIDPKGTNLTLGAKFDKARNRGDGIVDVGTIFAGGTDLGIVKLDGDLGAILIGDNTVADGAVKSLTVGSIGVLGAPQDSIFRGKVGALIVRGDVANTSLINDTSMELNRGAGSFGSITIGGNFEASRALTSRIVTTGDIGALKIAGSVIVNSPNDSGIVSGGKIGSVTVGGSAIGADGRALVVAGTTIGKVAIGGNLDNAYLAAGGNAVPLNPAAALAIAGVTVKGRVQDSLIQSGININGEFNPDTQIGAITVNGDWIRSDVSASAGAGADGKYGTTDDILFAATGPYTNNTAIISRIASVFVKGQIFGTSGGTDSFGFVAQTIGKFGRGPAAYTLKPNPIPNAGPLDVVAVSITGDTFLREVL